MGAITFYTAADTAALTYAAEQLMKAGYRFSDAPSPHITHLLLPVPSMASDGCIKGGKMLSDILKALPENVTVIGGNLPQLSGYRVYDLMQDPAYVAENAYITAHCAVRLVMDRLPVALRNCKILVIGWGRIGKCLAALLKGLEAQVTVAARKETDRAILNALGYQAIDIHDIRPDGYRVIFNTAPAAVLNDTPANCLKIDLASTPGIGGTNVIHARGLPGKDAPEASGNLIARTIIRLIKEDEL